MVICKINEPLHRFKNEKIKNNYTYKTYFNYSQAILYQPIFLMTSYKRYGTS